MQRLAFGETRIGEATRARVELMLRQLDARPLAKPWGRTPLPPPFESISGTEPIGEIWFSAPGPVQPPLLIKYLFTSEALSIQVHPDDRAAKEQGAACGKDEAWFILQAEPEAVIALGTTRELGAEELEQAALDGTLDKLVAWHRPTAGDFIASPGGTIHAIGAGLALIEIQQNCDLTYRLFDYGRPRELHLAEALAVARRGPVSWRPARAAGSGRTSLGSGPTFSVEAWSEAVTDRVDASEAAPAWLIPVRGVAHVGSDRLEAGSVWLLDEPATVQIGRDVQLLIARPATTAS